MQQGVPRANASSLGVAVSAGLWPEEAAVHSALEETATSCQLTQPPQRESSFAKGITGQQLPLFKTAECRGPGE